MPWPCAPAACGHLPRVDLDRCWECHLEFLRATGQGARADRLVEVKRQHDEGLFDMDRLEAGMVGVLIDELTRSYDDPEQAALQREARRMRDGKLLWSNRNRQGP